MNNMEKERVILVWACPEQIDKFLLQEIMDELCALVESAGGLVVNQFTQARKSVDPRWVVGEGKIQEVLQSITQEKSDLVVFYNSLSGSQQRNIEEILNVRVTDRTRLILDIFSQRARSQEGKLQVELAQLLYTLPRLTGMGQSMSRPGGGIGTRGPGETKLETDRRVIKKKISQVKDKLEQVSKTRMLHRQAREHRSAPIMALVGYTSAGKSTLFNRLSGSQADVSAKLFSTLDPLIRRVDLGSFLPGCYALISDTVGFIREMPKEVISAFKATLEEIKEADIIVIVLDVSHPAYEQHRQTVEEILADIKQPDQKVWVLYNKIDSIDEKSCKETDGQLLSAKTGQGVDRFLQAVFSCLMADRKRYLLKISKEKRKFAASIEEWCILLNRWYEGDFLCLDLLSQPELIKKFQEKTQVSLEEYPV